MEGLAIAIFVYRRPEHTRRLLRSLSQCKGVENCLLYVYCDGPSDRSEQKSVDSVAKLVETIRFTRSVTITRRKAHSGLAESIISGVSDVLKQHDRVVVLEDDLRLSEEALSYFDFFLKRFETADTVFSVSGYSQAEDKIPALERYPFDIYFLGRNSSWGWATWADRWGKADWDVSTFAQLESDKYQQTAFNENGRDLYQMLARQQAGTVDSWAIRWTYTHFLHNGLSVIPVTSYIANDGLDGSGTHRPVIRNTKRRMLNNLSPEKLRIPDKPYVEYGIRRDFSRLYPKDNLPRKAIRVLRRKLILP